MGRVGDGGADVGVTVWESDHADAEEVGGSDHMALVVISALAFAVVGCGNEAVGVARGGGPVEWCHEVDTESWG